MLSIERSLKASTEVSNSGKIIIICPINNCGRELSFTNMGIHSHINSHKRKGDIAKEVPINSLMSSLFNIRGL